MVQSADQPNRWEDGKEVLDYNPFTEKMDATYPQIRWIEAIQEDFAARADWCVMDFVDANHPPIIKAVGSARVTAKPGATLTLEVETSDPDGDLLETKFWIYKEVGTYNGEVQLSAEDNKVQVTLDALSSGQLHLIGEVKDNGAHPMIRYVRFVVEI